MRGRSLGERGWLPAAGERAGESHRGIFQSVGVGFPPRVPLPLTRVCHPSRCRSPSRQGWAGGISFPVGVPPNPPPSLPHPRDRAGTRVPCTYLYF